MLKHICFIPPYAYPKEGYSHGGIGSFTKSYLRDLVQQGIKVTLIEFNKQQFEKVEEGIIIVHLKRNKVRGFSWLLNAISIHKKLKSIHKESPIDIVESAELGLAFIKKVDTIKYIIRLHGGHHFFSEAEKRNINIWKGFQEKMSFKKSDGFIAVSKYVKEHTNEYLSYNDKPIAIIPSTVNFKLFTPDNDIIVNQHTILFAGRLCEKKGIKNLILAMPAIISKFPQMILEIYGKDSFMNTKSYKKFLDDEIIPKIGEAKKNVFFKGEIPIEELAKKYTSSKICVFPSYMETQGLVVIEAMAMKKGVVFSKYGPGKEVIEHRVNGMLCDSYDVNSIAEEIIWALENPLELKLIEKKALQTIQMQYNLDSIINRNIKFYHTILNN